MNHNCCFDGRCSNAQEGENEVTEITIEERTVVRKGEGTAMNRAYSSRVFLLYTMKKAAAFRRDWLVDSSDERTRETVLIDKILASVR